jgi:hypothetical protein
MFLSKSFISNVYKIRGVAGVTADAIHCAHPLAVSTEMLAVGRRVSSLS